MRAQEAKSGAAVTDAKINPRSCERRLARAHRRAPSKSPMAGNSTRGVFLSRAEALPLNLSLPADRDANGTAAGCGVRCRNVIAHLSAGGYRQCLESRRLAGKDCGRHSRCLVGMIEMRSVKSLFAGSWVFASAAGACGGSSDSAPATVKMFHS